MTGIIRKSVLFACLSFGTVLSLGQLARAQQQPISADVAITYTAERAKIVGVDCGCFWLQGGGGDFALTFYHGLGVAANITGVHSGDVGTGLELDTAMFAMGPRYTFTPKAWPGAHLGKNRGLAVYGEGLFGGVHGFNTLFPSSSGVLGAASSFAMQFGGGVDLRLARHLGIRAAEVDYVRSTLPNGAANVQNDLRLSGGLAFHFGAVQ